MEQKLLYKDLTETIIGEAMEVHRNLGPGFLEGVYEDALCLELIEAGLEFLRQEEIKISYKGEFLRHKYRADLIVEGKVIVDNKATTGIKEIDQAQVFNYLKATGLRLGLIFNFAQKSLEWKRIICDKYFCR